MTRLGVNVGWPNAGDPTNAAWNQRLDTAVALGATIVRAGYNLSWGNALTLWPPIAASIQARGLHICQTVWGIDAAHSSVTNTAGQYWPTNLPATELWYASVIAGYAELLGDKDCIEIGNEWNDAASLQSPSVPDPVWAARLCQWASAGLPATNAPVLSCCGLAYNQAAPLNASSFISNMFAFGLGAASAVGFHPYAGTGNSPIYGPTNPNNGWWELVNQVTEALSTQSPPSQLWLTEFGDPSGTPNTPQAAAAHCQQYLEAMLAWPGKALEAVCWYTISDEEDTSGAFGLVDSNFNWKPAAYVFRELADEFSS